MMSSGMIEQRKPLKTWVSKKNPGHDIRHAFRFKSEFGTDTSRGNISHRLWTRHDVLPKII